MRRHLAYLKYLLRHKWFVFLAGLKTGAPLWRLVIHDWTKFLPSEWFQYARAFYAADGSRQYKPNDAFWKAWLLHTRRNKHHWQYWNLRLDTGIIQPVQMPESYVKEMVADWAGAGRAISGRWEVSEWWMNKMKNVDHALHYETKMSVVVLLCKHFGLGLK